MDFGDIRHNCLYVYKLNNTSIRPTDVDIPMSFLTVESKDAE